MRVEEFRDKTSALKIEKQSFINDTYFWVQLARDSVLQLPDTRFEFEVPKTGKKGRMRKVARNDGGKIKQRIIDKDIYNSAFVSMVAAVEDYLSKVMTWILLCDNKRIKCTISGVNFVKDVSVIDLIDKDRDEVINGIIQQRVEGLFYASPQKQQEYFDKALGIQVEEDIWGRWFEINRDGGNFMVSFPEEKAAIWEEFISAHLEFEYWNEYLTENGAVFLFHLQDGIKRYEVNDFINDEVLGLCERLCECKFESIKRMLSDNHFYKRFIS